MRVSLSRLPESNSDWGYLKNLEKRFQLLKQIGRGGNGVVRVARDRDTGEEYACKILPKVLNDPRASEVKKATHCEYVRREVWGPQSLRWSKVWT